MDRQVKEFLDTHRISVLGILQDNGTVHAATLHFAYAKNPLCFFFMTEKKSQKCTSLLDGKVVNASLVIGFDEKEFVTIQMEGKVQILQLEGQQRGWDTYLSKFPKRNSGKNDSDIVLLQFIPTWGRYRDYKTEPPIELQILPK